MKNIISLALLTFLFVSLAKGQSEEFGTFKIGLKLSPNISWMKPENNNIESEGSLLRAGFGLIADIHFTENYAIGTGVNIVSDGGKLSYLTLIDEGDNAYIVNLSREYFLQHVEIPITLKLRTNEIGYITYWGQFGLGLSAAVDARSSDEVDYLYESIGYTGQSDSPPFEEDRDREGYTEDDVDIFDDIRLFRFSMIIAAGIEYNISGNTSLVAGLTFSNGFNNLLKGKGVVESEDDKPVFDSSSRITPNFFDLDAISNFFELNLGIMF